MGAVTAGTSTRRPGSSIVRAIYNGRDLRMIPFTFTMSNSYATGGDTTASAALPTNAYSVLLWVDIMPKNGYQFQWDATNDKVLAYSSGGTQVTSTTDLSAIGAIRAVAWVTM